MDFFNLTLIESLLSLCLIFIILNIIFIYFTRKMIYIIISLLFIYIITGIMFLICGFDFLGYMILIIYAGAIIILFIFVLMLIDIQTFSKNFNFFEIIKLISFLSLSYYFLGYYSFDSLNNHLQIIYTHIIEMPYYNVNEYEIILIQEYYIMSKYLYSWYFYINSIQLVEFSYLAQYCLILYKEYWFETLFIGSLILFSLIYIIYFFKK